MGGDVFGTDYRLYVYIYVLIIFVLFFDIFILWYNRSVPWSEYFVKKPVKYTAYFFPKRNTCRTRL